MARKRRYCYDYPRPAVTADVVIFTLVEGDLRALLIQRRAEPFKGRWAIPGGFAVEGETLEQTARRELQEETGVTGVPLQQLQAFGDPGRDPRGWVVTVAFYVLLDASKIKPRAADDAADARWFSMSALPKLAFDHDRILAIALERVRNEWHGIDVEPQRSKRSPRKSKARSRSHSRRPREK